MPVTTKGGAAAARSLRKGGAAESENAACRGLGRLLRDARAVPRQEQEGGQLVAGTEVGWLEGMPLRLLCFSFLF